jgi:cation diffusion facilitator family transporter
MSLAGAPLRRFSQLDVASRAAALSFGSNAVLMAAKITVGVIFGSVAVLGDGVDSAQDVLASALALLSVRYAIQPADEAHPYGHGKAESLAALSQAALIFGGAVFIAVTAIYRLATGGVEIYLPPSLAIMGVTAGVNLGVAAYAMRAAKVSGSVAIASDARHLMTNVVQAVGVIAALVLVGVTGERVFDPIVALLLAAYLTWIAYGILRSALSELIDTALPDEDVALLEECLRHEGHGVRGYHALRTRKSGRERYIDVHVLIDPTLTVSEAHHRVEEIEAHLRQALPGAIASIHLDPDEPGIMERGDGHDDAPAPELRLHRH